jgi:hypothetical protein
MLEAFGKEGVFLAQIARFENVSPDELFLLQAESLDDALALRGRVSVDPPNPKKRGRRCRRWCSFCA